MMESMLLLLLALGGGTGSPSALPGFASGVQAAAPVTGVWRGTWVAPDGHPPLPVEAVLAPGKERGTLIAVVIAGAGRARRSARLSGRYDSDGARLTLPSGGALRLSAQGLSRLVGEVKGGDATGFVPGDGALELSRVRR
jgi:hypothetical protein